MEETATETVGTFEAPAVRSILLPAVCCTAVRVLYICLHHEYCTDKHLPSLPPRFNAGEGSGGADGGQTFRVGRTALLRHNSVYTAEHSTVVSTSSRYGTSGVLSGVLSGVISIFAKQAEQGGEFISLDRSIYYWRQAHPDANSDVVEVALLLSDSRLRGGVFHVALSSRVLPAGNSSSSAFLHRTCPKATDDDLGAGDTATGATKAPPVL